MKQTKEMMKVPMGLEHKCQIPMQCGNALGQEQPIQSFPDNMIIIWSMSIFYDEIDPMGE